MITYANFVDKYAPFGQEPYNQEEIEGWLLEVSELFPQIDGCLHEKVRLQATYYALRYLESQEYCESPAPIQTVKSRLDLITYSLAAKGDVLVNDRWGNRLVRLFKAYGCYHWIGENNKCNDQICISNIEFLSYF